MNALDMFYDVNNSFNLAFNSTPSEDDYLGGSPNVKDLTASE